MSEFRVKNIKNFLKEKIKFPFKKQQKIEEKKPLTFQEAWDIIIKILFSLTTSQIAIIWSIALWAGIFLQYSIISDFIWNDIQWIYLVNIDTAILSTFALILYCIISLFFPLILVISIWLTIISIVFNVQLSANILAYIFIWFFIISIIFFYFTWYRNLLLYILEKYGIFYVFLVFVWLIFTINFSQKEYSNVEIVTWREIFTWKLFFSNWENYFIETWSGKIILPKSEVMKIVLP